MMTDETRRVATPRTYLMCPPAHFAVTYAINPWMRPDEPADAGLALRQWDRLRQTYLELGHEVRVIAPVPGLPDMVFAANGAMVVAGTVLGARFRYAERAQEGRAYLDWFRASGWSDVREPRIATKARVTSSSLGGPCSPATGSGPTWAPRASWPRCSACRS